MAVDEKKYLEILKVLAINKITLVAVSKTKSIADIKLLYDLGQRNFGENYVQEMVDKQRSLPGDIRWHFIGHLQSNKVKYIAPFVYLIHSVDSLKLLQEINKEGLKNKKKVKCLLQVHIASEDTKYGMDENELQLILNDNKLNSLTSIEICGLMGMASFTNESTLITREFKYIKSLKDKYSSLKELSIGMSADYRYAIEYGSTIVRVGSLLFGDR